jgi:hypothetical protein
MKLAPVVGDLKVSLEKILQLLGIIKVCKLFEKSDLIDHAMMYNKDSLFSSRLEGVTPFP